MRSVLLLLIAAASGICQIPKPEHKLFAWEQVESGSYQDPDFLKPYESRGESVRIQENSHESKQLKLIPAGDTVAQP